MSNKKTKKTAADNTSIAQVVTETTTKGNQPERLIPLKDWHHYHPWPPLGGMRHIRFYAEEKGATDCFVKKGGCVLVRERKFLEWASMSDAA